MGEWLLNLPIPWMAFIIFAASYLIAACVYLAVVRLAVDDRRARAFKAFLAWNAATAWDHLRSTGWFRRHAGLE